MKRFIVLFLAFPFVAFGQNYVPNPSFEYQTGCPNNNWVPSGGIDEMAKAYPWESYKGSPDLFDPCVDDPDIDCDAPESGYGYQHAFDGESYAGIYYSRNDYWNNSFEVIGCPLIEPLAIGQRYFVSMRFSLADEALAASNHIGALFLMREYDVFNDPLLFPDKCHVCTDSVIMDSVNWIELSGIIEADSAYTHIAIGHFLDSTNYVNLTGLPVLGTPYYFVDYICVVPEGGDCSFPLSAPQPQQSASFTAFPNPIIKSQSSILHFSKESSVEVYDLLGQKAGHYENVMEIDAGSWPAGVYFLNEKGGGVTKVVVME